MAILGTERATTEAGTVARSFQLRIRTLRRRAGVLGLLAAGIVAALPLVSLGNTYQIRVVTFAMIWMGLASAWNIISGFTGYLSLGHAALFGVGAYVLGIGTARYDTPIWVALVASFVVTGIVSVVLGLVTLRIKGHYFAIATLGLAEAVRVLINAARPITQGAIGFPLPIELISVSPLVPFYVSLVILVLIVAVAAMILGSDFGLRLLAIREDEVGAEALGVATARAKIAAFVISGAFTGLLGGVYAWVLNFLSPESVLVPAVSLQIVVMVIVGGMGTIVGPLVGGLGFYLLSEFALVNAPRLNLVVLGSILVIAMLFFRRGIFGTLQTSRWWPRGLRL